MTRSSRRSRSWRYCASVVPFSIPRRRPMARAGSRSCLNGALKAVSPHSTAKAASRRRCARHTCQRMPWPRWLPSISETHTAGLVSSNSVVTAALPRLGWMMCSTPSVPTNTHSHQFLPFTVPDGRGLRRLNRLRANSRRRGWSGLGRQHEMLDDQLAASGEEAGERLFAVRRVEHVGLFDAVQGKACRSAVNRSRRRVNCFSLTSNALRAASHSSCETTLCGSTASLLATGFDYTIVRVKCPAWCPYRRATPRGGGKIQKNSPA
jgi:hypothetical protein